MSEEISIIERRFISDILNGDPISHPLSQVAAWCAANKYGFNIFFDPDGEIDVRICTMDEAAQHISKTDSLDICIMECAIRAFDNFRREDEKRESRRRWNIYRRTVIIPTMRLPLRFWRKR